MADKVDYNPKTVRYGVFRGDDLQSPQFKQRYKAEAFQKEHGGNVRRFERDTLRPMKKVPVAPMEKMEQSW